MSEHAVIIRFNYGYNSLDELFAIKKLLRETLSISGVGEYDGHEMAIDYSDGIIYMYGPNAEHLFKTVLPILEKNDFMQGAIATLRFGPPEDGIKEIEVAI